MRELGEFDGIRVVEFDPLPLVTKAVWPNQ
jgi:hypothetical protein